MSQRNVAVIQTAVDAFNRGDLNRAWEGAASDFELDLSRANGPYRGTYRSEQLPKLMTDVWETWESARAEVGETTHQGRFVITQVEFKVRGRESIEVGVKGTWVWEFREGDLVRATVFLDRGQALEAVQFAE